MTDQPRPTAPPPGGALQGLAEVESAAKARRGPPPVHLWTPPFCGDLDMVIRRDGSWTYHGSPIGREALVRLFASILRKDPDGRIYLVTPVEKVGITVEDAPFLAVLLTREGAGRDQILRFTTNVGDEVVLGPENPLRAVPGAAGAPALYIEVRRGLEARLNRPVYYQLVDIALEDERGQGQAAVDPSPPPPHFPPETVGVWSLGRFFPIAGAGG